VQGALTTEAIKKKRAAVPKKKVPTRSPKARAYQNALESEWLPAAAVARRQCDRRPVPCRACHAAKPAEVQSCCLLSAMLTRGCGRAAVARKKKCNASCYYNLKKYFAKYNPNMKRYDGKPYAPFNYGGKGR
jgi:hypothetical protein